MQKLPLDSDIAINQIRDKGYANPYLMDAKQVFLVGINFKDRELNDWGIEIF
jgi:hypothetical protein